MHSGWDAPAWRPDICDNEDDNEDDDTPCDTDASDEDPWRCLFGAACCMADPVHRSDECFTAEWADAYFADQAAVGDKRDTE